MSKIDTEIRIMTSQRIFSVIKTPANCAPSMFPRGMLVLHQAKTGPAENQFPRIAIELGQTVD